MSRIKRDFIQENRNSVHRISLRVILGITVLFLLSWIRIIWPIGLEGGWLPILKDARVQHKIGEVLLFGPMFYVYLSSLKKTKSEVRKIIGWSALPMLLGGLLNGYVWMEIKDHFGWHPFCFLVMAVGILAVPICRRVFLPLAVGR